MTIRTTSMLLASVLTASFGFPAFAADSAASDVSKPAIGSRVGGSPADAEFRAVIQQTGDDYRRARTDCKTKPSEERSNCTKEAKAAMQAARAAAKKKHDDAVREARAAAKNK